jgi:bifunctional non-homologous end joining protein LigD
MYLPLPFKPMEPKVENKPFDSQDFLFQVKWDGVRCLSYIYDDTIELYNRKLNRRTLQYPEIVDMAKKIFPKQTIIDGEIIAFDEKNKPNFRRVLKRDLVKSNDNIKTLLNNIPVFYMVFDIIYYRGKDLTGVSLNKRLELLEELIPLENKVIKNVESFYYKGISLFGAVKNQELEGIVAKKVDSPYLIGEKTDLWKKIKVWKDIVAVIGGWVSKMGEIRSLLLGLYNDNDELYYIGNASSGVRQSDWLTLQNYFELKRLTESPFINPPRKVKGEEINWIIPEVCVKIEFLEWTEDFSIRNPKVISFIDINPKECRFK